MCKAEMKTIAETLDAHLAGDLARIGDSIIQRFQNMRDQHEGVKMGAQLELTSRTDPELAARLSSASD